MTHAYVNSTEFQPDALSRTTVPLNPRHSGTFVATWEKEGFGRVGIEGLYTGHQTLTGTDTLNPYRTTSRSYIMFGVLIQRQIGPMRVFLNGENLTDRRMTRFQPLLLPTQAPDGRWTTDEWGPLEGRVINVGFSWRFSGEDVEADRDASH
jgi:outer membrane receptor for ferrienterochelin and colicins